ncbi:SH3 domain-containing protein [Leptospira sp. 96542]|nr:SH3 domain-containing protein [Leptospira sp. 96542]
MKTIFSLSLFFLLVWGIIASPIPKSKKNPSPKEIQKQYKNNRILIPVFGLQLHLFADEKSDVLRKLKFGELVFYDPSSLESPNSEWIPVKLQDGLSGFLKRSLVNLVPESQFHKSFVIEAEKQLNSKYTDHHHKMEIADSIFYLSQDGRYTGDEFIYLRAKAGFALKKVVDSLSEGSIKPDSDPHTLEFLKKHQSKLLYDYASGHYFMDSNYFWKLIESYPVTKHSDYAGYLATETIPKIDCKADLKCQLENLRKGKMRYIYLFPTGNYVTRYTKSIVTELKKITEDPDSIPCFQPISEVIKSEITIMGSYLSEYRIREKKLILPFVDILKKECLK